MQALTTGDNPTLLVLTKDGRLEELKVKIGLRTPDEAEVISGLEEGDPVVVGSRSGLNAGQKVQAKFVDHPKINLAEGLTRHAAGDFSGYPFRLAADRLALIES